jgi:vacuolar-type H+-ATPase subunit I/STV1
MVMVMQKNHRKSPETLNESSDTDETKAQLCKAKKWQAWPFIDKYLVSIAEEPALVQEMDDLRHYIEELQYEIDAVYKKLEELRNKLHDLQEKEAAAKRASGF